MIFHFLLFLFCLLGIQANSGEVNGKDEQAGMKQKGGAVQAETVYDHVFDYEVSAFTSLISHLSFT